MSRESMHNNKNPITYFVDKDSGTMMFSMDCALSPLPDSAGNHDLDITLSVDRSIPWLECQTDHLLDALTCWVASFLKKKISVNTPTYSLENLNVEKSTGSPLVDKVDPTPFFGPGIFSMISGANPLPRTDDQCSTNRLKAYERIENILEHYFPHTAKSYRENVKSAISESLFSVISGCESPIKNDEKCTIGADGGPCGTCERGELFREAVKAFYPYASEKEIQEACLDLHCTLDPGSSRLKGLGTQA